MPQDGDQLLAGNQGFPSVEGTVKIDHPLGDGQETGSSRDPKYYHNALSCVVLGVVVMIVLFFVCKFLNDLQVSPSSGHGRKGKGHLCDALVESVPISLRGHTQVCLACTEECTFWWHVSCSMYVILRQEFHFPLLLLVFYSEVYQMEFSILFSTVNPNSISNFKTFHNIVQVDN